VCVESGNNAKCECPAAPAECQDALLLLGGTFCTEDGALAKCEINAAGCFALSRSPCDPPRRCTGPFALATCRCPSLPACR
jgi:hypothetical protein